ncbi:MAG: hypothetical protein QXM12_06995 [Nitrososphaerota archaeon]
MPVVIKLKRGPKATMPTLAVGEVAITTDTYELYVGTSTGNKLVGENTFLKLSGGVLTGYITLHADPVNDMHPATKRYVDNAIVGLKWKAPVRVATTTNITLSGTQTIDGIAVNVGDRVLVKDQTNPAQNGIYVVQSGNWVRASDADTWDELVSCAVFVMQGNTNADKGYVCTIDPGGTLGVDPITFVLFTGGTAPTYTWGNGLYAVDTTVHVGAGDGIVVEPDAVSVNIDTTAGLKFDNSTPKKIQLNVDPTIFSFSNGALTLTTIDGGTW